MMKNNIQRIVIILFLPRHHLLLLRNGSFYDKHKKINSYQLNIMPQAGWMDQSFKATWINSSIYYKFVPGLVQ